MKHDTLVYGSAIETKALLSEVALLFRHQQPQPAVVRHIMHTIAIIDELFSS